MKKFLSFLSTLFLLSLLCGIVYFNQPFFITQVNKVRGIYYVNKGDEAYSEMNIRKAISFYNKGVKYFPGHYEAWYNLGNIYVAYEDYNSAIYAYSQAFKHNPNMTIARMNYGIIASEKLGDFDSAITQYNKITKTKPIIITIPYIFSNKLSSKQNKAIAYYNKGVTYRLKALYSGSNEQKKIKYLYSAVDAYKKSTEIDPTSYDSQYNLGVAYQLINDFDGANKAYCKAIQLEPMSYEAHYNRALLLRKKRYHKEAYEEIEKAVTLITALGENLIVQDYASRILQDIGVGYYSDESYAKYLQKVLEKEKEDIAKEIKKDKRNKENINQDIKENTDKKFETIYLVNGKVRATDETDTEVLKYFSNCSDVSYMEKY